jgi:hypothetical protein
MATTAFVLGVLAAIAGGINLVMWVRTRTTFVVLFLITVLCGPASLILAMNL